MPSREVYTCFTTISHPILMHPARIPFVQLTNIILCVGAVWKGFVIEVPSLSLGFAPSLCSSFRSIVPWIRQVVSMKILHGWMMCFETILREKNVCACRVLASVFVLCFSNRSSVSGEKFERFVITGIDYSIFGKLNINNVSMLKWRIFREVDQSWIILCFFSFAFKVFIGVIINFFLRSEEMWI